MVLAWEGTGSAISIFTDYKLLHNMPWPIADFGLKPMDNLEIQKAIAYWKAQGEEFFEWEDD